MKACDAPDCDSEATRGRYCRMHASRLERNGSLTLPPRQPRTGVARAAQWSDEEMGELVAMSRAGMTATQIGRILDRSASAIYKRLAMIRNGWTPTGLREAYSDEEDRFIRNSTNMTARQVAEYLGRTVNSIAWRRTELGVRIGHASLSANSVGNRPLVAKSCRKCGRILSAAWYQRRENGRWASNCTRCHGQFQKAPHRKTRPSQWDSAAESRQAFQTLTLPLAARHGEPYTTADHEVLSNPELTHLEKALILQRTYVAVADQVRNLGYESKVGLGDQTLGEWFVKPAESA